MKWLGCVLLTVLAILPLTTQAADVSVTATVPSPTPPTPADTVVIFRGIAYPNSQVTIQRQGTILATVPADPQARFDVTFGNQPTGIFTYALFAEDARGVVGRESNFTLSISQGTTTTVSGIFLGPTIGADQSTIKLTETVTVLGTTAPSSEVTIYVASEETTTFKVTAGTDGLWTKQFLGSDLGIGDHNVKSKAVAPTQEISGFSNTVPITVTEPPPPPEPEPTPTPAPAPAPDPCDGKNRADINCDGKVNLVDFSILLFYWKKTNPANARADISRDGVVNLTDLSILLFHWTK